MFAPTLCYQPTYPHTACIRKRWVTCQINKLVIFTGFMGFMIEPVHKWMVRHIYFPCLRNGLPKGIAVIIAFFVSAVFHEVCIDIPCRNFKMCAFIGIMFQLSYFLVIRIIYIVPLVVLTNFLQNRFKNSMVGNMIVWLFCILGQPMCVLLYYHDLMNQKAQNQLLL